MHRLLIERHNLVVIRHISGKMKRADRTCHHFYLRAYRSLNMCPAIIALQVT